jgi:hypothetical protein
MSPMPEIQINKLKHLRFGIMWLRGVRERLRRSCLKVIKIETVRSDPPNPLLAKTLSTDMGLSKTFLEKQGLVSIRTLWIQIQYPAKAR